jgi:hypothetical protein
MTAPGPITAQLEDKLTAEIRRRGIVVWFDKRGEFSGYVDDLVRRHEAGEFPFPVVPFRGSFLEMMLDLEPYWDGLDPEPLLIHLPGHTEESIRETPILAFYRSGFRFRCSLETLIREAAAGQVDPETIEAFLREGPSSLEAAEAWLARRSASERAGIAGYLDGLSLEWILDGLFGENEDFKGRFSDRGSLDRLADHIHRHTGMDRAFGEFFNDGPPETLTSLRETFGAWLMCVEYVQNLTVPPTLAALKPIRSLSDPLRSACFRLVDHFRSRHPDAYAAVAMGAESHLREEIESHSPDQLGHIDTFNLEQERILAGAVDALLAGDWESARIPARQRTAEVPFWLRRDPVRRMTWTLVDDAARLGHLIKTSGRPLDGVDGIDAAVVRYADAGWRVDNAHRRFEQRQVKLFDPKMPHFAQLHAAFDRLRERYREWADALAEGFTAVCEREGFLPEPGLRQRSLYEDVVHPLLGEGRRVALFLLDGFRFEMAAELEETLADGGARVRLRARLAELPTVTAVGMNALAPVVREGTLTLAGKTGLKGFSVGEYTVRRPDDRVRAMGDRSLAGDGRAARGITLADVCRRSPSSLKKSCSGAGLIVVHGREIDAAGGANVGSASFEVLLRQIRTAWNGLRAAGVADFVFTADHGFQLNDPTVRHVPYGRRTDPEPRYVLAGEPRSEAGMIPVSLTALGYAGRAGYILFRRDTAVFETARRGDAFVHGGNSLQERVIPVLTVSHRGTGPTGAGRLSIAVSALPSVLGFSRVRVSVTEAPNTQLTLSGTRTVALAIRSQDRADIAVAIKEAPGGRVEDGVVQVEADGSPVEIIFDLTGPRDERVRLEVYALEGGDRAAPAVIDGYFEVSGRPGADPPEPEPPAESAGWADGFEDPGVRRVFVHLYEYGVVSEAELNAFLGSPRAVRRFALKFETHAANAPFSVRVETTPEGKRYVKG